MATFEQKLSKVLNERDDRSLEKSDREAMAMPFNPKTEEYKDWILLMLL